MAGLTALASTYVPAKPDAATCLATLTAWSGGQTDMTISLEDMNIIARTDVNEDGTVDEDWNLRTDESPNLTGLSIAPDSFVLIGEAGVIGEGGVIDVPTNMSIATGEGGINEPSEPQFHARTDPMVPDRWMCRAKEEAAR